MKAFLFSTAVVMAALPVGYGFTQNLGNNITLKPTLGNLYNTDSCWEAPVNDHNPNYCCAENSFGCIKYVQRSTLEYWEPAAIVEVTCRSGFSHLQPGIAPRQGGVQSCQVGPNWFFEAHVWASSGRANGDRTAALGYSFRENTMRCQADPTTGANKYPNGYGIKHKDVTFNTSGPGRSSKAFISEEDANWDERRGTFSQPQACSPNNPDIQACWGNPNIASGWVTHPNQAVAAALVGYRALNQAMAKKTVVTPRKEDGWRMSMDYPFIMSASPHAQSMGLNGRSGRFMGSSCFTPGNPGPFWFTAGGQNVLPNAMNLKAGTAGKAAYVPDGVYIFTYWVKTGCIVHSEQYRNPKRVRRKQCLDTYDY